MEIYRGPTAVPRWQIERREGLQHARTEPVSSPPYILNIVSVTPVVKARPCMGLIFHGASPSRQVISTLFGPLNLQSRQVRTSPM